MMERNICPTPPCKVTASYETGSNMTSARQLPIVLVFFFLMTLINRNNLERILIFTLTGVLRPVCQPFQLHDTCKTKQNSTNQIIVEDSKLKKKVTCLA